MPDASLQPQIAKIGAEIFATLDARPKGSFFSRKWLYQRLMQWAMQDEGFKTQLFRFVDVLPSLSGSRDVLEHLQEYLVQPGLPLQKITGTGLLAARLFPPLAAGLVRQNVRAMSDLFIVGRDGREALPVLRKLWAEGVRFTVDILGEAVVSDPEADVFAGRYLLLLESLAEEVRSWQAAGPLAGSEPPLVNLSVKISALCARINPASPETSIAEIRTRLDPILQRAAQLRAFVNLDMESHATKDLTLRLFREILPRDGSGPACGCVIQAYLRESENDLRELLVWAKAEGQKITVRLVKGAYWDHEGIHARQRGWPVPVYENKAGTDANFERLTRLLLDHREVAYPAIATHNIRSIAHTLAYAESIGAGADEYEFQALYGMAEPIRRCLVARGARVREYCPVGELLPGMAYLVRRLLENTSNEGFLRASAEPEADRGALLADPSLEETEVPIPAQAPGAFANHPPIDWTLETSRTQMRLALDEVRATFGADYLPVIDGQPQPAVDYFLSENPARPSEIVGRIGAAGMAGADQAVLIAREALPEWSAQPVGERAAWLLRVADLLADQRLQLAALQTFEVGKTWEEADADVCEAIDFCRYYAQEASAQLVPRLTQGVPGEVSLEEAWPRGVGVVVAPWNFPLAILCGMTVAALVCGNTVLLKPAEQSSVIAARFHTILLQAGLPPGAAAFLPGRGEIIGARLVGHSQVDFIAFTGSREVGLQIWETAGKTQPGQRSLKTAICEMGGKNALIVDTDADLDEAVVAILHSAFGFQGQKCSALSRLIVLQPVYEILLRRLIEAAAALRIGDPELPENHLGPVIDSDAFQKITGMIEEGKKSARLAFQSRWEGDSTGGWYVPATIFGEVSPEAAIFREEIFGPVLCVSAARDLDEALLLANDTDFALTGGVFSRSPVTIGRVKRELRVGNLYINRSITGAVVERHPFGGFGMSGGGTKAGGRDYLRNFILPRITTENTVRRGFAPETKIQGDPKIDFQ